MTEPWETHVNNLCWRAEASKVDGEDGPRGKTVTKNSWFRNTTRKDFQALRLLWATEWSQRVPWIKQHGRQQRPWQEKACSCAGVKARFQWAKWWDSYKVSCCVKYYIIYRYVHIEKKNIKICKGIRLHIQKRLSLERKEVWISGKIQKGFIYICNNIFLWKIRHEASEAKRFIWQSSKEDRWVCVTFPICLKCFIIIFFRMNQSWGGQFFQEVGYEKRRETGQSKLAFWVCKHVCVLVGALQEEGEKTRGPTTETLRMEKSGDRAGPGEEERAPSPL